MRLWNCELVQWLRKGLLTLASLATPAERYGYPTCIEEPTGDPGNGGGGVDVYIWERGKNEHSREG